MFNSEELEKIKEVAGFVPEGSAIPAIYQIGFSEKEFIDYIWGMRELTGLSVGDLLVRIRNSNFNLHELKTLAEICEDSESKFKFSQIPGDVYSRITSVNLVGIVRYINSNYKYPRVCENLRVNFFVPNQKGLSSTIANWVKKEEAYYERMAMILDSYLLAKKRESSSKSKVVVLDAGTYGTRKEYVDAIVDCISGVQDDEIYLSEKIGDWVKRLKTGYNEKLDRFIQCYYGINFINEFKRRSEEKKQGRKLQLANVFDAYLIAKERDGRPEAKIIVGSRADYPEDDEYKNSVIECLADVAQLEVFHGVPIGKILYEIRAGRQIDACRILNEHYGIDIQTELVSVYEKRVEREQDDREMDLGTIKQYLAEPKKEDGTRKLVVKDEKDYKCKDDYKRAVIMCLDQVGRSETYLGREIGRIVSNIKYGQTPIWAKQLSAVLGVDVAEGFSHVDEYYKVAIIDYVEEYLVATERENSVKPKRVVGRKDLYPLPEQYRNDVMRVLLDIGKGETFKGVRIRNIFENEDKLRVINEHFGIDYFRDKVSIEEASLAEFWDSYLVAPKRENKRSPKIVIRPEHEYDNPRDRKDDIVRVIAGIVQDGEEFRGVNIGTTRIDVAHGKNLNLIKFWNKHYDIDFLADFERVTAHDEWYKRQICEEYGIKYTEFFKRLDIYTINRNLQYILKRFGKKYVTRDTIVAEFHNMVLIMDYLDRCGMLDVVLTCPYVLNMTIEEFQEREVVLSLLGRDVLKVDKDGLSKLRRPFGVDDRTSEELKKKAVGYNHDLNYALKHKLERCEEVFRGLAELAEE